jgi:hypothetical protein
MQRIIFEIKNVNDGDGLGRFMADMAAKYPVKPGSDAGVPVLPVFPDLTQALNIAACDTRAVIVLVEPDGAGSPLEESLSKIAFRDGVAGRAHMARMTASEWAEAKRVAQVTGESSLESGVFLVAPDPWGLEGEVWAEFADDTPMNKLGGSLFVGLERFSTEWRKEDRITHMRTAREQGLTWTEYDADLDAVVPIGEGSTKLGAIIKSH